jgi:serine/threonine-protein kinase
VGDPTAVPADPTLDEVLERLHAARRPDLTSPAAADLYFLGPSDRPDLLGTLGTYEVLEVIGQGGMGIVLQARDPALDRLVALKVLAPALALSATARQRFTREARAAAAVRHDHVVTVHGVHDADGLPYLVMQYVAGESLQARLDRTGPLDVAEVVRIGLETASGLAAAHAQGLIHRDVKPANILLAACGLASSPDAKPQAVVVKITDFGLARTADDVGLTRSGVVAGTPEYMAPEQARGEPVDQRSDLFSLGAVLYACCAGRPPFRGSTALAVLRQVSEETPPPLRSLNPRTPAWLEDLVGRLLAKDPAQRFPSADAVVALLGGYRAHLRQPETIPAPQLPSSAPAVRCGRRKRRVWLPVVAGVCLLVAVSLAVVGPGLARWLLAAPGQGDAGSAGRPAPVDFYQDFRGGRRPLPPLELYGEDADAVTRPEDAGLRITLPADREAKLKPVGVALTNYSLAGDFEITATYELLAAGPPLRGGNGGIALNVGTPQPRRFAKVGRFLRAVQGSVYEADGWVGTLREDYQFQTVPTEARAGQLRLVRKGATLSFQASDGTTNAFREISRRDFGTEDAGGVRFVVTTNVAPIAVDARLVDLRVRGGPLTDGAASPPLPGAPEARSKPWLTVAALVLLILLLSLLGVGLAQRRRAARAPAVPPVSCACPGCGAALKARAALAGKRVKCPRCGLPVAVPERAT